MSPNGKDKSSQKLLKAIALGSGGSFIEREGVSTLSIHGYPWALRYLLICVFKIVCLLFNVGLKSFFERFQIDSRVRVFENLFLKAFRKCVGVKSIFEFLFEIRASILENLPYGIRLCKSPLK